MKFRNYLLLLTVCLASSGIFAEETTSQTESQTEIEKDVNLEKELESLNMPINQGPAAASLEKLYSVQNRYLPLTNKHEITVNFGKNLNAGGLLNSQQVGGSYRYHLNDRFSFGVQGYKVFNEVSSDGELVMSTGRILVPEDYVSQQLEAFTSFNVFYGKFRLGLNRVFYFDQYIALGAGMAELESGNTPMISPDIGIALWLGKSGSVRFGIRNELYNKQTLDGEELNHNVVAHLSIGYLFGGN
jgi:outer membrane beta-barrel protein